MEKDTLHQLISETIKYGAVDLALSPQSATNTFSARDLLMYLHDNPSDEDSLLAYLHLCEILAISDQYIGNEHFLKEKPEYALIARGFYEACDEEAIEIVKGRPELIDTISASTALEVSRDSRKTRFHTIIIAGCLLGIYPAEDVTLFYKSRENRKESMLGVYDHAALVVKTDWIEEIRPNACPPIDQRFPDLIMDRLSFLKENARLYYEKIAYPRYSAVIEGIIKERQVSKETCNIPRLISMFPNETISLQLIDFLGPSLSKLSLQAQSYILGFPIHEMTPNIMQINTAAQALKEKGVEKYLKDLIEEPGKTRAKLPISNEESSFSNETDVTMERIEGYFSFDVVIYQAGSHIFRFTRPEFHQLVEKGVNTWTNEKLPRHIIETMKQRLAIAQTFNLPKSVPARDALLMIKWVRESLGQLDDPPKETVSPGLQLPRGEIRETCPCGCCSFSESMQCIFSDDD